MIRYNAFCKIVETGGFTRAATALGYTQAAVSQMIRSLEAELEVKLILRMRAGIKLTPEGEILYPMIKELVDKNREMLKRAKELYSLECGAVRIGVSYSSFSSLMAPYFKSFAADHPDISFSVLHISDPTQKLESGEIEIALTSSKASLGFELIPLFSDTFSAFLPDSHKLHLCDSVGIEELKKENLIVPEEYASVLAESFGSLQIKYKVSDDTTAAFMTKEGIGISLLPSSVLKKYSVKLQSVPLSPTVRLKAGILYSNRESLPIAARRLIEHIRLQISE